MQHSNGELPNIKTSATLVTVFEKAAPSNHAFGTPYMEQNRAGATCDDPKTEF